MSPKVRLGDLVDITNGYAFKSSDYVDSGVRVIRITNVQKGSIVDNNPQYYPLSSQPTLNRYSIAEGDILMSLTGNVGRVGRFPKEFLPAYINQRVCRVKSCSAKLNNDYLFYVLNSDLFERDAIENSAGVAQLNLSTKWIEDYQIPLPPLAEQQKIAAILDAADSLRQKDQQLVERYTALSQSLFLEMFGDPVTNPMGWARRNISDVCLKVTDGTHQSPRFISEGIPFLLVSNIVNNEINFKTKKFISEVDYDALTRNTPIEKNDILYTSVGSYGNPAIVEADKKFCFQRHIAHLKPNHQIINVKFLHAMLLSSYVKNQADKLARGVAQKTLNLKEIKSVEIYLPNYSDQNQFAERVQLIEAQKQQAQRSLEKSEALFNSLLQRAFTGEFTAKIAA